MTKRWKALYISPRSYSISLQNKSGIKHLMLQVERGHVVLTRKDIEKIPAQMRFIDIFIALVEHGYAKASWNLGLLKCCVSYFLELEYYKINHRKLADLFTSDHEAFKSFVETSSVLMKTNGLPQEYQGTLFDCMMELLETPGGREYSWSSTPNVDDFAEPGTVFYTFMASRFLPDLREVRRTEMGIQKARMDYVKEEMMAFCWHPDRVIRYLDLGWDMGDDY